MAHSLRIELAGKNLGVRSRFVGRSMPNISPSCPGYIRLLRFSPKTAKPTYPRCPCIKAATLSIEVGRNNGEMTNPMQIQFLGVKENTTQSNRQEQPQLCP